MDRVSRQAILGLDFYLATKSHFAEVLARDNRFQDIAPRTFVFPQDFERWQAAVAAEPETIWISKPGSGARGEGIYLVTDPAAVEPKSNTVLQEYIANPHLIDGYKYTLRFFVAVTSLDPLQVWVFPDGLTKLTTQPFTTDRAFLDNRFVHLTNPAVLRGDTSADFAKQRMTHVEYRQRLREAGIDDAKLFKDIHEVIAKSLLAVCEPVLKVLKQGAENGIETNGQFMLIGYDILVDDQMRPWMIEANAGPSLEPEAGNDTATGRRERELKEEVAEGMLILAGVLPKRETRFEPLPTVVTKIKTPHA